MKRIDLLNLLNPLTHLWYNVSITTTGGGFTQTTGVDLLVGGRRIYFERFTFQATGFAAGMTETRCAYLPIAPDFPPERITYLLEHGQVELALARKVMMTIPQVFCPCVYLCVHPYLVK